MTFLSEFLPGFWKHRPIQIFAAILIYAAMQQGDDHKTRALLNPVLLSCRPQCGRQRKPGQESQRMTRGERALQRGERRCRGAGPWGWAGRAPTWGGRAATAIQVVPPRSVSCVLSYEMSRRLLASQRVRVTPVMVGESARSKSPLLAGKRMVLPNAHTLVLLRPVCTVRKTIPLHLH